MLPQKTNKQINKKKKKKKKTKTKKQNKILGSESLARWLVSLVLVLVLEIVLALEIELELEIVLLLEIELALEMVLALEIELALEIFWGDSKSYLSGLPWVMYTCVSLFWQFFLSTF